MKLSLHTIMLFAQHTDTLKHFYAHVFNLPVVEEIPGQWVVFGAGGCRLALHQVGPEYLLPEGSNSKAENNVKIIFETADDITGLRAALLRQNVTIGEVKTFDNYDFWLCNGEDPEGNVFQLQQRK
jgi:catechol 2,3-dioxygenase-like lactoylglutathione lyase family enzyme